MAPRSCRTTVNLPARVRLGVEVENDRLAAKRRERDVLAILVRQGEVWSGRAGLEHELQASAGCRCRRHPGARRSAAGSQRRAARPIGALPSTRTVVSVVARDRLLDPGDVAFLIGIKLTRSLGVGHRSEERTQLVGWESVDGWTGIHRVSGGHGIDVLERTEDVGMQGRWATVAARLDESPNHQRGNVGDDLVEDLLPPVAARGRDCSEIVLTRRRRRPPGLSGCGAQRR